METEKIEEIERTEGKEFIVACCVCHSRKYTNSNNSWKNTTSEEYRGYKDRSKYDISHTYCPSCAKSALESLSRDFQNL